jgi:hypothetical protein
VRLTYTVMGMFGDPKISIADLFPHPLHWRIQSGEIRLQVSRRTAQIVLLTLNDYPEVERALTDYMGDIRAAIIN